MNREQESMEKPLEDALYLMGCALRQERADGERLREMDGDWVYGFCKNHSVLSLVYPVLKGRWEELSISEKIAKRWQTAAERTMRKLIVFEAERKKLFCYLDEKEIWHVPLKGIVLQKLYPSFGMRDMSDHDIWFDGDKRQQLREELPALGYELEESQVDNHDIYQKGQAAHLEMHLSLFEDDFRESWLPYFETMQGRLLRKAPDSYEYHMTDEDFYIHMLAHAYRHYATGGIGVRSLADVYVYEQKKGKSLDWEYVKAELSKLEIAPFEKDCKLLARRLFAKEGVRIKDLEKEQQNMLWYMVESMTYGTAKHLQQNEMRKLQGGTGELRGTTRLRYMLRRTFPSYKWCAQKYPIVGKVPILLPFLWIYRLFRVLLFRRKLLSQEIKYMK